MGKCTHAHLQVRYKKTLVGFAKSRIAARGETTVAVKVHAHTHIHIHTHTQVHIHTHISTHTYTSTHTQVHIHALKVHADELAYTVLDPMAPGAENQP